MNSRTGSRLGLLAAAVLFSTGGAAIKATALTSWQVASFRSAVAAAALLALLPEARRGWSLRVLPPAAAYGIMLVLFVLSNKLTAAANAVFLQSTAPLYLLLLSPWLLKEPIRRGDLLFASAVGAGLTLFFLGNEPALATAPDPFRGNILGALSGLAWAFTISGLRWMGRSHAGGAAATVAAGNVIACLAALPMALPVARAGWTDLAVIVFLGLFQIGLAYALVTRSIRHVPAFEAATLLLLEPVLNPIWAWLLHGERPTALALIGGVLILAATLAQTWKGGRTPIPAPAPLARR
jgi:drug/metabolite transporter (DMT)-like permease